MSEVRIKYSMLEPLPSEQLTQQLGEHIPLTEGDLNRIDRVWDGVEIGWLHGVIPEAERLRILKRHTKWVERLLKERSAEGGRG